jgi:hypothetical protein
MRRGGVFPSARIVRMGHFTAIGMRTPVEPGALIINTCSGNDTAERGTFTAWTWSNPTNRAILHSYEDVKAVSVECLWQGTKIFTRDAGADEAALAGAWRRGKAKRPIGAWAGVGQPLITSPGEARRRIYLPAFKRLIAYWMLDHEVATWVARAKLWTSGPVYLRDWDTGRGLDRNGPMSHAWVLATWLNTGLWPDERQLSFVGGSSS